MSQLAKPALTKGVRPVAFEIVVCVLVAFVPGCSPDDSGAHDADGGEHGAAAGAAGTGGAGEGGRSGGAASGSGGARAGTGTAPAGGGRAGVPGRGGAGGGAAGMAGARAAEAGGAATSAGAGGSTSPSSALEPLDCGPNGVAIENAGPPKNRVNYVIIGDGYTQDQLDSTFIAHVQNAMKKRFSDVIGQPYGRYRRFVNICAIKQVSATGPIGRGATAFDCSGDDQSRLARCNTMKVNDALAKSLPASFEVDWKALVLNNDRWWNTGSVLMLWSGGHKDAAGAALHEGGHGFHQLADEYGGSDSNCSREYNEVNSTADATKTAGKWDLWLGYDQAGATGMQRTIAGSRYCDDGQYRPSSNSMMNQLFGDKPNTSFNSVSREKMIMDIWRAVTPIDAAMPAPGALEKPGVIELRVVDREVIRVDWSVDGEVVKPNGGESFDVAEQGLAAGKHTIGARAYDSAGMDLVRYTSGMQYGRMNWARSQQTVQWTVEVP